MTNTTRTGGVDIINAPGGTVNISGDVVGRDRRDRQPRSETERSILRALLLDDIARRTANKLAQDMQSAATGAEDGTKRRSRNTERDQKIAEMRRQGKTDAQISKLVSLSFDRVKQIRHELGLKDTSRRGRNGGRKTT